MKNKGITLIELLAVFAVLAMILIIVVPNVNNILNNSKDKLSKEQVLQIKNAARSWGVNNLYLKEDKTPSESSITISTLKETGYLEDKTVKNIDDETTICIKYEDNQYVYKIAGIEEGCNDEK